ncbi:dTDP-4-dehydrorhamnose 3,5-epimerase family protein [Bacillus sp. UNC41MFS5]|uniref:dTDP-4-dehydrorhamnose 3,5-epimerase family protein n=1 Tax=Bacillus sp. UNC41MFS5 TaxID=1449046 RepID=UPI0009DF0B5E|nr:dTDP-4-dehydrorhamnose 3,5-epimerase family protein [Bacillus sp. UNC41MFS5]
MQVQKTSIPGCYQLIPLHFTDNRGSFIKTFHQQEFAQNGLETNFVESYYSISNQRVLRGLHFQVPPWDNIKLIYCLQGKVMDVVVDLRTGSPTYGKYEIFQLDSEKPGIIYIPSGVAHGFYVETGPAIMVYMSTRVHSPQHDAGIHWKSLTIPWSDPNPIISKRDQQLPLFDHFSSPFRFSDTIDHN